MNLPTLKVYEIDYEFIIKNYLDPKLWNKVWTVFTFDHYVFTLTMESIDVKNNSIYFVVQLRGNDDGYLYSNMKGFFKYYINNSNIAMLKKSLQGTMVRLVEGYEEQRIKDSDEYKQFEEYYQQEEEQLKDIAEQFLDENNVTNEDIRDVYIEHYVEENSKLHEKLDDYICSREYKVLTSLYLILAQVFKANDLERRVIRANEDNSYIDEIIEEINEIVAYMETDEWVDEMNDNLESL